MRTRQTVALGMAIALATGMTMQPVRAGNRQGAGSISGIAKDAKKPYEKFKVRGEILEGPGKGNRTQPIPLDAEAKFNLTGIDLAIYEVQLLNEKDEIVCTEGKFDLTQKPNEPDVVIDCGNPLAWVVLPLAVLAAVTGGVVAANDDPSTTSAGKRAGR